jgi:hypothetical protein
MSVRERAAAALDDDYPDVLAALRRGLDDKDSRKAAAVAVSYVQLVYGGQLQRPSDETTQADPLDVASMSRDERDGRGPGCSNVQSLRTTCALAALRSGERVRHSDA